MTINLSDNNPRVSYSVGQGVTQTSFAVSFEFFDNDDLNVYVDGVLKTITTHYTVSGGNGSTGSVAISVTGASGGSTVVITRDIDFDRVTDFPTSGPFNINALNTELDRLTAIAADLNDRASRALQLTDFDAAVSLVLPEVDTRKGKTLAFNASTGAVEAGPSISDTQTVSAASTDIGLLADIQDGTTATNAITTVASNNANVSTVAGISSNVTTVAGISSDVTAVAADATDIGTVASSISNVNTLGAISSNVTTVAGNTSNINTVAGISSNVSTVAGISSDVSTVSGIASNVTAVASDATDIGTVASNISNVNSVGSISSDVSTVAGISSNITTVAGKAALITADFVADLNTLAVTDVINDINTLATSDIVSDLNQLATSDFVSDLNTMATTANVTALNNVSGGISNVNTVSTNISNVNSLASVLTGSTTYTITVANVGGSNIFLVDGVNNPTLALVRGNTYVFDQSDNSNSNHPLAFKDGSGNSYTSGVTVTGTAGSAGAKVTFAVPSDAPSSLRYYCTVHGNAMGNTITASSNNLSVVAGSISNVNLTGGSITNVNNVGGSIANVNTVASNLSSINDFADKYRIGSSDPTSNNDEGDLFYNTTSDTLKIYNGSAWEAGVTAGSGFLALTGGQLTGNLTFSGTQTVDGRDVSADGTKLDGIEAGATADQTAAEIRTLVESATDSNVFTDADHSKLNAIEAGATAGGGSTLEATASGAIANGDTCIVNTNGTVTAVGTTTSAPSSSYNAELSETSSQFYRNILYDTTNNKIFIFYKGQNNFAYGRIGTVAANGASISWGLRYTIDTGSGASYHRSCFDPSTGKIVVIYRRSTTAYARVVDISSGSISVGSESSVGTLYPTYMDITHDASSNKNVLIYKNNQGYIMVRTIETSSANSNMTIGTLTVLRGLSGGQECGIVYHAAASCCIGVYRTYNNNIHAFRASTIDTNGSNPAFGSEIVITNDRVFISENYHFSMAYDTVNEKSVVVYSDDTSQDHLIRQLSISTSAYDGTLSASSAFTIDTNWSKANSVVYNASSGNFAVAWEDESIDDTKAITVTINGSSFTKSSVTTINSSGGGNTKTAYDPDTESVWIFYHPANNTMHFANYFNESVVTNLTTENYIGISDAAYSDGATATIQIVGAVDDAQSGLTAGRTHYIQNDGSLSTTAANPSVVAGTAVSATKLIVKG